MGWIGLHPVRPQPVDLQVGSEAVYQNDGVPAAKGLVVDLHAVGIEEAGRGNRGRGRDRGRGRFRFLLIFAAADQRYRHQANAGDEGIAQDLTSVHPQPLNTVRIAGGWYSTPSLKPKVRAECTPVPPAGKEAGPCRSGEPAVAPWGGAVGNACRALPPALDAPLSPRYAASQTSWCIRLTRRRGRISRSGI